MKKMLLDGLESVVILVGSILIGSFFYNFFQHSVLGIVACFIFVFIGVLQSKQIVANDLKKFFR